MNRDMMRMQKQIDQLTAVVSRITQIESKPRLIIPASGSATLYRFTLNASLATGTADADILNMDGTDTGNDETVRDPLGIFASLTAVDDAGICVLQDGNYYVIQAPCP